MIKVAKDISPATKKKLSYRSVMYDEDGWADAKKYIPDDYDLMYLQIKNKRTKFGWIVGDKWTGLNIRPSDEILYWKKKES